MVVRSIANVLIELTQAIIGIATFEHNSFESYSLIYSIVGSILITQNKKTEKFINKY